MISPSVNLGKRTENVKNAKSEMKKTQAKRRRIPRRGPGVAELEKILNEQQGGQDSEPQFQHISPPSPPPPPPLPPPHDYSSWSDLPSLPSLGLVPPPLPTDTQMNIPSIYFPNFEFSASSVDRPYYSSMVNFIRGCASSAGRNYDEVEHPSSQRSTDFNHTWTSPEELEQMVNAKRPRDFLEESHWDPNLQSRRVSIKEPSSSSSSLEINPTAINLNSNFRDTKRGFLISSRTKRSGSYQLAEDRTNLMVPGSLSTSNQFASPFNFQETMEEASHHGDEGGSVSYHNKSTFNSLYESNLKSKSKSKSKGSIIPAFRSEADTKVKGIAKAEVEEDGIDLNLKL